MRIVFVMDSLDRVNPVKDTSFAFIEAAQRRGHTCLHCLPTDLSLRHGVPVALVRRIETFPEPTSVRIALTSEPEELGLRDVDAIFIRKDPPFDADYLYATLLLEHARGGPLIVNDPRGLRDANEKIYALQFPEWTPRTLISSHRPTIEAFVRDVGGKAVIKPVDLAGGAGVLQLDLADKNARGIVEMLTNDGRRLAIVQEFLPEVTSGDKRVLLLDGEPLGAILRVARSDDFRSNMRAGGSVQPTELTERELAMVRALAPKLRQDGLVFVGLDVIGERLTEVNVTSPTGIQELERFTGSKPADKVIAWVEARRAAETAGS
jgi:glutathione synthase